MKTLQLLGRTMPNSVASWWSQIIDALILAAVGAAIGIGQCLRERERDWLVILGRAVCTGGLAVAAGAVLIWWPELSFLGQLGVAAGLASLGTSALERIATKWIQRGQG